MRGRKGLYTAVLSAVCLCSMVLTVYGGEKDPLQLQSRSAFLMDAETGTVLYEKNSHEMLPPASVTKIMTMLLIYEAEAAEQFQWTDCVTVSAHAASMGGSQVFLEEGEEQTAENLLKCIAIASANDAAVAMAEFVAGSEEAFVDRMNEKAAELGMKDTHFENACGLDTEGHLTSAADIGCMSRELITKFPEVMTYTTTWQDSIVHETKKGETVFGLTNTNKLIKWYEGATGLKTGSTGKALYCLSGTAERDGLHLIAVIMAAPDFKVRFQETMQLLDYGFSNYAAGKGMPAGTEVAEVLVRKGKKDTVTAEVAEEISLLLQKGEGQEWETETEAYPAISAPIEKGEKVGELVYLINGKIVGRTDLVAAESVEQADIRTMLEWMLRRWF